MRTRTLYTILALALLPLTAAADTPGFTVTGDSVVESRDVTFGFKFEPTVDIEVTALGHFDLNDDGLGSSHLAGLWKADGTPVAQVTVPQGTAGQIQDRYRFAALPEPALLKAGEVYLVGIQTQPREHYAWRYVERTLAPQIVERSGTLQGTGSGLVFPDASAGSHRRYPVNFLFEESAPASSGPTVLTWNGSCTTSQVGANGSVQLTKTWNGTNYDVLLEGTLSINSPTYGYVRHAAPAGLLPVSSDPQAYTCELQEHATKGDTSGVGNYGGNGVHVRRDTYSGYTSTATIWFPEKFYNGAFNLRCAWQTEEPTDAAAWSGCPGIEVVEPGG